MITGVIIIVNSEKQVRLYRVITTKCFSAIILTNYIIYIISIIYNNLIKRNLVFKSSRHVYEEF